jgi:hypothetical protein
MRLMKAAPDKELGVALAAAAAAELLSSNLQVADAAVSDLLVGQFGVLL